MPAKGSGGGGASSGAIRAGRAFVELFADDTKLQKALLRSRKALNDFGGFLGKAGTAAAQGGALLMSPLLSLIRKGEDIPQFAAAWERLGYAISDPLIKLAEAAAPYVDLLSQIIRNNPELVTGAVKAGAALLGLAVALKVVAFALPLLSVGVGAISLLLSPIGLVTAAVVGLGALLLRHTQTGRQFGSDVGGAFNGLRETATGAWKGITAAIANGDLEQAFRVARAAVTLEWEKLIGYLTNRWIDFKSVVVDTWKEALVAISMMTDDLTSRIAKGLIDVADAFSPGDSAVADELKRNIDLENRARNRARIDDLAKDLNQRDDFRRKQGEQARRAIEDAQAIFRMEVKKAEDDYEAKNPQAPALFPNAVKGSFSDANFGAALGAADQTNKRMIALQEQNLQVNKQVAELLKGMDFARFK